MKDSHRGRILGFTVGINHKQVITIEIDGDFSIKYEDLKEADIDIEVRKHRDRRSLDANAYAWVLIDKIAERLAISKESVYQQAIRDIPGVSDIVCVQNAALDKLISTWTARGLGWQAETLPSKIHGCTNVVLYYGSSGYDTKQMSALIDCLIQDAKALGIETATPMQIAKYKDLWAS